MEKIATQQELDKRLKRVVVSLCTSLHFQQCALYIYEDEKEFCIRATAGLSTAQEEALRLHSLSMPSVTLLMHKANQVRDFYFIPHTSALWQNSTACFILGNGLADIILVPLMSEKHTFLGILLLGYPYSNTLLTDEALLFLDVFAEQAAMAIEAERLYTEAQRSNEERTALIEIGRALFAPSALHDLQDVYQTIYEQIRNIMPVDALFISRYNYQTATMTMEYLIDEGVVYPPFPYTSIPVWIDKLLLKEKHAYAFGTAEEYRDFAIANERTPEEEDNDLFGNEHPSQSLLFVPIFYGDDLIGILSAQSYQRHVYTQRHLALLEEIGVQAGIALNNALLYTKLRQALKEAQKSEQLTNHFLMTASHELRTPLTSVQGYLELLTTHEKTLSNEMKHRFVELASLACEELILLLGNVMDTSCVDQDRVTLNVKRVQVKHTVQRITEILEPTFTMEKRSLVVDVHEQWHVQADDLRLRQILLNVVGNALKYASPPSKIAITASSVARTSLAQRLSSAQLPLPASSDANFIVVAVRDWGPGIAPENVARLFAKFVRLESAMNSVQRGAGLGLYLCRLLAEAMNGQIWVESAGTPGKGATFLLALPQS
ncbi:MAG: hypothetical protein NVS4B11_12070 [Ktedonobacteraceae bacterium]